MSVVRPESPTIESPAATESREAARLTSSAPVQLTLLFLYSLPLLMLLCSAFASRGFKNDSSLLLVTLDVVSQYAETLREAFATFVIPFVTALAAGRWSASTRGGMNPMQIFFVLVILLLIAIGMLAYIHAQEARIMQSLPISDDLAVQKIKEALDLVTSYVKEVLTYISLLLGVSLWRRS